ncbi:MAG: DUF3108 domain-containing protein [Elusimicrobia bacterium]|nr:DUF3108 domain-containing protein [Elusimicrobiota bacterium]
MRIKKLIKFSLLVLILSNLQLAAEDRRPSKMPWGVGEKLTFAIKWGFITGGYAHLEIAEEIELAGRDTYRIVSQARSAAFFDPFYKVRDTIESYMDSADLHTVRYEQDINEGSYSKNSVIIYDHDKGYAYENDYRFEVPRHVQDVLSSLYYLRTKELEPGKTYEFDVGTGKENWPLVVKIKGRERIKVSAGKFDTILVEPEIREEEGIFKQAKGTLRIWLTDDERKMPVLMKSKIPIGHISAVLQETSLPGL